MLARALLLLVTATIALGTPEYPKQGEDIYDTHADGKALIASAEAKAAAEHKNVLLVFGANWCVWCHRLHTTLESNQTVANLLHQNYELVMIDVNTRHGIARNAEVDANFGHPTRLGLPVLVVTDATGKPLTTQDSGELEDGKDAHDPAKIAAFLQKWAPRKS